jgi:hypothetical protein
MDTGDYQALLLPGMDRSTRERAMQNQALLALIREYDQGRKLITGLGSRIFHFTALLIEELGGQDKAKHYRQWSGI